MFRECYFEYAGRYSGEFNLIMAYVTDSNDSFISGGSYTPTTDSLPALAESILYSLNYGENPLEFSVEIVNPEENIPVEQFTEIKDWLFGQDGWKKLKLESEIFKNYYLKCLLIPESDIVDGTGFRGVKCTIRNISGFWYGEDKVIQYTREDFTPQGSAPAVILYPNFETQFNGRIYPIVTIRFGSINSSYTYDILNFVNDSAPRDRQSSFRAKIESDNTEYIIDTRHGVITCNGEKELPEDLDDKYGFLHFYKGANKTRFAPGADMVEFRYTPMYRLGGF